jgi:hypothetical protein
MTTVDAPLSNEISPPTTIRTTLYDLIEVISAEVEPEEESLVVATVTYMLESGRITFLGEPECSA